MGTEITTQLPETEKKTGPAIHMTERAAKKIAALLAKEG